MQTCLYVPVVHIGLKFDVQEPNYISNVESGSVLAFAIFLYFTFTTLWSNSADNKLKYFSYIPRKTGFDISCKSTPLETISVKCQNLFSGKVRKIFQNVV